MTDENEKDTAGILAFCVRDKRRSMKVFYCDPTPAEYKLDVVCLQFSEKQKVKSQIFMTTEEAIAIATGLLHGVMKADRAYDIPDRGQLIEND